MSHANLNGGASVLAHPAAVQVLAQSGMRVLAPVATATAAGLPVGLGISSVTTPSGTSTQAPSTVCAQSVVNSTIPGPALTLGKGVPMVPRMTTLAPVQLSAIPSPPAQGAIKGLLTTGSAQNPITIAQLTVKPNTLTTLGQQPILTAAAVNFQSATPTGKLSSSFSQNVVFVNCTMGIIKFFYMNSVTSTPLSASRQMSASVKPMAPLPHVRPHLTQLTQVIAPTTIVSSVGQVMSAGTQLSTVMTPVSVVPSLNHAAAMAQVIGPSQLGKVVTATAAPFIKSVYPHQQHFLPQLGAVTSQPLVKPIVVVTTANVVPTTVTTSAPQQTHVTIPATR